MDDKLITDSRIFPEEMHTQPVTIYEDQEGNEHSKLLWWVLGLLVLLVVVFAVGMWAGRRTSLTQQTKDEATIQAERQAILDNLEKTTYELTPAERSERLHAFFGE